MMLGITLGILGILIFVILYSEKRGGLQKYYRDYTCRSCGKQIKVDVGSKVKCPNCGGKDLKQIL